MRLPEVSRLHLLPVLFTLAVVNPFTYYVLHGTRTYFWVIPLTLIIWFAFKWEDLAASPKLGERPRFLETAVGCALVAGVIARTLLQDPSTRIFGLFDMLIVFAALVILLFGYRSLRVFWVPACFLAIMGLGYSLEQIVVDSVNYAEALAGLVALCVRTLGGDATNDGATIVLSSQAPSRLLVDYGCTGIKGILAFAFIASIPIMESAKSRGRKVMWMVITLAGFVVASVLRLVAVVFAVTAWGQAAVDYHTTIGFAFFMAWLVIVTYFGSGPSVAPTTDRNMSREGSGTTKGRDQ